MAQINGQSCLENIGLTHRPVLLMKNEYSKEEEYSDRHPNALADGDGRGRGTGHGGHGHSLPDCTVATYIGEHFQSPIEPQLDTNRQSGLAGTGAGDCVDVHGLPGASPTGRNRLLGLNIYGDDNPYFDISGTMLVDTSQNVADGQFVVGSTVKTEIQCASY